MSKPLRHILEFHSKSMSVLSDLFARAKAENRAALIGYMPAGFPTTQGSIDVINAMVAGGVDIVEVGYPYSDPVMDGPVIQRATEHALSSGFVAHDLFTVISKISAPTLAMTYWNPIERYGVSAFTERLAQVGGVGVITPDLTIEESDEWIAATSKQGIDRVYVVAPSTSDERLQKVIGKCSGFVYAASLMGVTGARSAIASSARELVERVRKVSALPICVGLGVSNAEQARDVANFADGVIVGSAFISLVQSASNEKEAAEKVRVLAQELAQAVTRA